MIEMQQTIVHVTEALGGGVLHCLVLLANRQVAAGDDVTIIHSVRPDTPSPRQLDALFHPRIRRIVLPMRTRIGPHDLYDAVALTFTLARLRPDVIHLHSSKAAALGRVAAKALGMGHRTIYSPHGFAFLKQDVSPLKVRMYLFAERLLHALCGHVVACSKSEYEYATRLLGGKERIAMVENAIGAEGFADHGPRAPRQAMTVCTSGRVTYQKAPWRFSRLAIRLAHPRASFVWFGDGEAQAVRDWIRRDALELTGWLDGRTLRARLAQCDLYVLPSLWEGMPIALIEAQAAGLPAVCSRVAGNRDVVEHGVTGFLARNDDELEMYTRRLIEDDALRARMGEAARRRARSRFGSEHQFRAYVGLYRRLLAGWSPLRQPGGPAGAALSGGAR